MKTLKHTVRLVMAMMAVLILTAGAVLAADMRSYSFTLGQANGNVGADVTLPISINDPTDIGGIAFTIKYDPTIFEFKGLEQAVSGWNINDASAYKVPQSLVQTVNGNPVEYYNPYSHAAPYDNTTTYPYTTTANTTLFYQYNDVKDGANQSVGRVLVSGASAVPLTGTALFNAKFTVKAGVNGTCYPIVLVRSIINNPQAGYNVDTFLPVLVGTTQPDGTGKYTSLNFPILPVQMLASGNIAEGCIGSISPVYNIGGKVTYGDVAGPLAVGCTVNLWKETATGYVFNGQTTVGANGLYNFPGKPAGNYKLNIISLNPLYDNYQSATATTIAGADVTNADAALPLKPQPIYVTGTVTAGHIPGLLVKVVDGTGTTMGIYNVSTADGKWSSGLLPPGAYDSYLVYGSLISAKNATIFDTTQLKSISGALTGLPASGGAVTAVSIAGKIKKTIPVTGTAYSIDNLVPANDYVVSLTAAGFPVTYYNGKTDVNTATKVAAPATDIDFTITPPTGHISGTITNAGLGVNGITVYGFNVDSFAMSQTTTNAAGIYDLAVQPGTYEVFVIKGNGKIFYFYQEDGTPTQIEASATLRTIAGAGQTVANTNINIAEADGTLSGKVTYRTANGDPAANVLISASTATQRTMALTGQDGKYMIGVLVCGVTYTVEMKPLMGNYPVQTTTIIACTDTTKDFIIDTGVVLSGTVTEQGTVNPVPGALIYLKDQTTGALVGGRIYFSGSDGKYSIRDIKSGSYTLEVNHPDYQGYSVDLLIGAADATQDVALTKGAFFKGTVKDGSGTPLPGVTIIVTRAGTAVYTVTNPGGAYSVYGLDATQTDYIIIAQKRGYERQALTGNQHQPPSNTPGTTVDFTLAPPAVTYQVSGSVTTSDNNPVANAVVIVASKTNKFFAVTNTDATGLYLVNGLLPAGDYNIAVIPGGNLPVQTANFTVTNASVVQNFVIPLGKEIGGTVSGPPAGTTIYVFLYKGTTFLSYAKVLTGDTFSFKGLADGSDYKLEAVAPGYGGTMDTITAPKTDANITLVPGP